MNFSADLFPTAVIGVAHLTTALLLALALYTAPWRRMAASERSHVFLGGSVFLLLLWSIKAGIDPGLGFHLLGATLFTLMFGWQFALFGIALVIIGTTLNGAGDWPSFSLTFLLTGALPVLVSLAGLRLAVRHLPQTFFVYVLVNGYLCGGIAMAATVVAGSALLVCCSAYTFQHIADTYLPFSPMMIFAEGFFTGMLAASMVLWRPEWVWTFDDRRYLAGK